MPHTKHQILNNKHSPNPDQASTWSPPASWLLVHPSAQDVPLPVITKKQLLPVDSLAWEDFERLCLRLIELECDTVHVSVSLQNEESAVVAGLYGIPGQAQAGIDIYARDRFTSGETPPKRKYACLQARRIKNVTESRLAKGVHDFLKGHWSDVSRRFIYATSASTRSTKLIDTIESLSAELSEQAIEFQVWDQEEISKRLKDHPKLVSDFFGRHWVKYFCGHDAVKTLGTRLDAHEVTELRGDLAKIYAASFRFADSGFLALRIDDSRPTSLLERFVTPDLVSTTPQAASFPELLDDPVDPDLDAQELQEVVLNSDPWSYRDLYGSTPLPRRLARREVRHDNPPVPERRSADQWIGTESLQVIVGEPGAGKSTLLRHLVLDLLSNSPKWQAVAERWGQRLPVWLPFHFFTQRVENHTGASASIGETLKAWLDQNDSGHIWPLVRSALDDQRLLLVVDGLDEWVSVEAGLYAIRALQTFAESHSIPLVASARPHGLNRLMLGAGWEYRRIAPLTPPQQRLLVSHYFHAVSGSEDSSSSADIVEHSVDDFLRQIQDSPDLRAISGTPLFLVLLTMLRLTYSANLPADRFEVYQKAVDLLIADHPANRRAAASVTTYQQKLSDRQLRIMLSKVAYTNQVRGDISTFHETVLWRDFVDALSDPNHLAMNALAAQETAEELMGIAEGELGILVRHGPAEFGFLHRVLQEQLVAEYITSQLPPEKINALFAEHVADPRWREVVLATVWRLSRPQELRNLLAVIREHIDESPAGLRAREILAEVTFGPYNLPAGEIQKSAPEIIDAIETHPYGPHRARLLDSFVSGVADTTTGAIVQECLERWTLLVQDPSEALVWNIAQLPPAEHLSETVCRLLIMALHCPRSWIAYRSAIAIAGRCSVDGPGSDEERGILMEGLLRIVSEPPTGLAQAAALIALTLEWREDPLVVSILAKARESTEESVRIVALSDALGVLKGTFSDSETKSSDDVIPLNDSERKWLIGYFLERRYNDVHSGLLIATLSEAVRDQDLILNELLESLKSSSEPYRNYDLMWPVLLNVWSADDRVVDIVCEQLRSDQSSNLSVTMMMRDEDWLSSFYPPESPQNARVAAAIEERISVSAVEPMGYRLMQFAAIDRGPEMKGFLLRNLKTGSFPHWVAEALCRYFYDEDTITSLREILAGEPVRASMVANIATRVLATNEVIPRLMTILRELTASENSNQGRYDIVASSLVGAFRERGVDSGPEVEALLDEALKLMPDNFDTPRGDPRYGLATLAYPSATSKRVLAKFAEGEDPVLEVYLNVFRDHPELVQPFLRGASNILRSLPAYLRAQICQSLADRMPSPSLVIQLTRRWADEVSDPNKSIASLAYHRALLRAREEGDVDDEQWEMALVQLGEQGTARGYDDEARRRAAWVGMCVCGDWSMIKEATEATGETSTASVHIAGLYYGLDVTLLQQIASRWDELRYEFGDTLLTYLSGPSSWQLESHTWDSLALVATQSSSLQQELEKAVSDDPDLLKLHGILTWFVTREHMRTDVIVDTLVSHLRNSIDQPYNLATILVAEYSRFGIRKEDLLNRLEKALLKVPAGSSDPVLEALAVLEPSHAAVRKSWEELSELIEASRKSGGYRIHPSSYFAVAYAAIDSSEVLTRLQLNLERLGGEENPHLDTALVRNISLRLRRDTDAVNLIREAILSPDTPDPIAAQLVSLLSDAVGLDEDLLFEVERRISLQRDTIFAPVVRDYIASANLSVYSLLMRVADSAGNLRYT